MRLFEDFMFVFLICLFLLFLLVCCGGVVTSLSRPYEPQGIVNALWVKVTPPDPSLRCWQRIGRTNTVICDRVPTEETTPTPAILLLQEKEVPLEK